MYCGQTVGRIKMKLGTQFVLGHIGFDGHQLPSKRGTALPEFSAYVRCGQTAGWIKIPLDMDVSLGPGDFVLDGDPARPHPQFSAHFYCGQTAGCIKMSLGMDVGLSPGTLY